ncbi:TPA: hypothetical protein QDZ95_002365 [Shewanella algae]|uniref:hypothetical protein n=2 Tax=Shewanella algae TaxID=38313 RepID=UPI001F2F0D96|nr:hypothetical protein [Shewanella algae]MCE9775179.1 hypothetical protein [Shewanella algae]HDS1198851.1 hypothetical protein [Shewanella algae]
MMRSLLLILTLIMTLGQAMMPAAASIAVSEHQPMATMNSSASATMTMDMDCCQGQQHCPDCDLGMNCGTMGNCASHCTPGVSLLTTSHPLVMTGSQQITLPSWSLQTAILSQQTPPPNSVQM